MCCRGCYAELHHGTVVMCFWGTKLDPVSLHNFAVVGVVANCAMGLFGEIIASLINEFGPSFPTQLPSRRSRGDLHYWTVWRRYYFFDSPFPHFPWVPETFLARFPVSVWLRPTTEDVSAFGQHRKFPPYARKTSGAQGIPHSALVSKHKGIRLRVRWTISYKPLYSWTST